MIVACRITKGNPRYGGRFSRGAALARERCHLMTSLAGMTPSLWARCRWQCGIWLIACTDGHDTAID